MLATNPDEAVRAGLMLNPEKEEKNEMYSTTKTPTTYPV
jgi:hypothetical protein